MLPVQTGLVSAAQSSKRNLSPGRLLSRFNASITSSAFWGLKPLSDTSFHPLLLPKDVCSEWCIYAHTHIVRIVPEPGVLQLVLVPGASCQVGVLSPRCVAAHNTVTASLMEPMPTSWDSRPRVTLPWGLGWI